MTPLPENKFQQSYLLIDIGRSSWKERKIGILKRKGNLYEGEEDDKIYFDLNINNVLYHSVLRLFNNLLPLLEFSGR